MKIHQHMVEKTSPTSRRCMWTQNQTLNEKYYENKKQYSWHNAEIMVEKFLDKQKARTGNTTTDHCWKTTLLHDFMLTSTKTKLSSREKYLFVPSNFWFA